MMAFRNRKFLSEFGDHLFSRRDVLRTMCGQIGIWSAAGGVFSSGIAQEKRAKQQRSCILLWMTGGASQLETFDPKPGVENGGPTKGIETSVPGLTISEFLPKMAQQMNHAAVIRSMSTKEGDHSRAMQHLHTGYQPGGPLVYPTFGSLVARETGDSTNDLPAFVSITPSRTISPQAHVAGFLGAEYAPMVVGSNRGGTGADSGYEGIDASLRVENLAFGEGVGEVGLNRRLAMLERQEIRFQRDHADAIVLSHREAYRKAARIMKSEAAQAFRLDSEKQETRSRYGKTQFGQSCLLARRLVERGVRFVEVAMSDATGGGLLGWDTHQNHFEMVKPLCETLDTGWDALLTDLRERGMLEDTLVVWMGEFGRTPRINTLKGRDHFPDAWSTVLAGGGIKGGQVVGSTAEDGMSVKDRPVSVPDYLSTLCLALGIDYEKQNLSNIGRPISIVEPSAKPVKEILS